MKKSKRTVERAGRGRPGADSRGELRPAQKSRRAAGAQLSLRPWHYAAAALAALVILLEVYGPALRGSFVFDDLYLPFTWQEFGNAGVRRWLAGVRPLLMLSFWVNYRLSNLEPYSYHLFNVFFHFLTGVLVFAVVRRLLSWTGTSGLARDALAAFAAALFLLHPVQTESVAYVASRSEVMSVMFFYAAFAVFLYRRSNAISWLAAAGVLLLFGAAVSTKEHTAVLPFALLLTDYYFNPGFSFRGIRGNWRLYALLAAAGGLAARMILHLLRTADTAGFAIKEFTWVQYFFTECRAIWVYIRLFLLPYGQNADPDFSPSRTLLQHGAMFGLLGLAALAAAAIWYRRRFPWPPTGIWSSSCCWLRPRRCCRSPTPSPSGGCTCRCSACC